MDRNDDKHLDDADSVHVRRPEIEPDQREGLDVDNDENRAANPPHTETGKFSAPKFGSAGSGGAEFEGPFNKN